MKHRIMKLALINDEIDHTINAIRYMLKYSALMEPRKKSEYGRLLVKLEKANEKLPKKIEVAYE